MHSVDKARHVANRPGRNARDAARTASQDPIILNRINRTALQVGSVDIGAGMLTRIWIVGAIVVFVLSFATAYWLTNLTTAAPDGVAKPTPSVSTSTSTAAVPSLQEPNNGRSVAANPLVPIVIRRSAPPDEQTPDFSPRTEISPPSVTVPESVTVTTPQQIDLSQVEDAKRVQQRLIDLGFLFGTADGVWGARSRKALQDFRVANGIGDIDPWDEATQERLLASSDAIAANAADISFIGGWGVDVAQCRESHLTITERGAEAFGAKCEFHSTYREGSNVWRLRALCADNNERWNANIRFTLSASKLTWSSERGTTTYVRCPS
jgi:hypothetical protein